MLMRFEPFRELDRPAEDLLAENRLHQVPVDAYRRGDEFVVDLDLPGADPGSIDLTVQADLLTVRASRSSHEVEGDEVQVAERGHGHFGRQLFLGESLSRDHITANYHEGVLTITIPMAEQVKPHKVEITHMGTVPGAVEAAAVTA
ncbi:MAG: Hsp20/alpha crystallin family protein [Acidimicrobiales bacterium]|jgi:HSP20 family protein